MKTILKADVTLPSDSEVMISRQFEAPRALVYEAFTSPEILRKWMLGPPGWSMPVCEMDLRVGGRYRWRWRHNREGREFGFYGEFREVLPPERIVHTEHYDPGDVGGDMGDGSVVTTEFTEENGMTLVVTGIDFGSPESRDAALATGMTDGMEMSYQQLDTLLGKTTPNSGRLP